ncbi:MAG: hypothetical protein ABSG71_11590 [Thermodesulfobacteriota bacterium]
MMGQFVCPVPDLFQSSDGIWPPLDSEDKRRISFVARSQGFLYFGDDGKGLHHLGFRVLLDNFSLPQDGSQNELPVLPEKIFL